MSETRWREIKAVCAELLDAPAAARAALLDRLCKHDLQLRREVEAIVAQDIDDEFVTPPPATAIGGAMRKAQAASRIGDRVGPFRLAALLGSGGMGDVYRAVRVEGEFEQTVAIKLLRADALGSALTRRLLAERQTLARMTHPYIARLIDGGQLPNGQPYLAMEYVDGVAIDVYCDREGIDLRGRLRLFARVCTAVEYAHRNLVLHCDLKPGNILVMPDGSPKLLDFGIARLLAPPQGDAATTQARHFLTPEYASPEQIRGQDLSTASDVYALGVVLYRVLTGAAPFDVSSSSGFDAARTIVETEPRRPSSVAIFDGTDTPHYARRRQLVGDLDTLVLKCLRKGPEERYGSAEQLRLDVERHLAGQPILARPPSLHYLVGKFVARHPLGTTASLLALAAIAAGTVTTAWQASAARVERDAARAAQQAAEVQTRKTARLNGLLESMLAAADPALARGTEPSLRELLTRASDRAATELANEPEVEASLRSTIGMTFLGIGQYARAEIEFARSLELRQRRFGREHPETLDSLNNLGVAYQQQRRMTDAERCYREAVDGNARLLGEHHAQTASAISNLATVLRIQGRLEDAEAQCRRALAIRERIAGRQSAAYAESLNNLASVLMSRGMLDEAERAARQVLEIRRRALGDDHPLTAQSSVNLGAALFRLNRNDEAIPVSREALRRHIQILGPDHPTLATVEALFGVSLYNRGYYAEAEALLSDSLRIRRAAIGPDSDAAIESACHLALCLMALECYEDAEPLLAWIVELARDETRKIPLAGEARAGLARIYARSGREELADEIANGR